MTTERTSERTPDYGLFVSILLTLERLQAPYMVIGAFAAIIYGARRTTFDIDIEPFEIWCARPEDVIVGKLMAWAEGRSRKHESDIYQMLVFDAARASLSTLDMAYIDLQAERLGEDVHGFWRSIQKAAHAARNRPAR